jgi:uncharacterized protein (TIGR02246 family)
MKRPASLPLAVLALALLASGARSSLLAHGKASETGGPEPEAHARVMEVIDAQVAAWNRGDVEAFVAAYAEDCVFLSPTGVTRGRADVLARYRSRYPDAAAMGKLTLTPLDVRHGYGAVGEDGLRRVSAVTVVSIAAAWKLEYEGDKPSAEGHTLIVLVPNPHPDGPRWLIVQDASM